MGCSASKSTDADRPNPFTSTGASTDIRLTRENSRRGQRRKSVDSGISLNGEYPVKSSRDREISEPEKLLIDQCYRKGIAFEIALGNDAVTRSPPKRLTGRRLILGESGIYTNSSDAMHVLVEKQIRAEQLREMERHSVVARQKRREARARRVQERRQKLQEELEMFHDEELNDIEVDVNFHDDDDYDFTTSDVDSKIPPEGERSTPDDHDVTNENRSNDEDYNRF